MVSTPKPVPRSVIRSPRIAWVGLLTTLAMLLVAPAVPAQTSSKSAPGKGYLLPQEQGLEMMVHVLGEVQKPGEYRVPDHTDALELIAKAGGPTEFANLSWVKIRRVMPVQISSTRNVTRNTSEATVLEFNLKDAWKERGGEPPPRLVPGDVVVVTRNSWFGYRRLATIVRDVAVVASAYFLYLRVVED